MDNMKKQRLMIWAILGIVSGILYTPRYVSGGFQGISFYLWLLSGLSVVVGGMIHYGRDRSRGFKGEYFLFTGCSVILYGCGQGFFSSLGIEYYSFYFGLVVLAGFIASWKVSFLIGPLILCLETAGYVSGIWLWGTVNELPSDLVTLWAGLFPLSAMVAVFRVFRERSVRDTYRKLLLDSRSGTASGSWLLDILSDGSDNGRDESLREEIHLGLQKREQFVGTILEYLVRVSQAHSCLFYHLDKRTGRLVLGNRLSVTPELINSRDITIGEGALGWVASGDLLSLHGKCRDECKGKITYYTKDPGISSFLVVPVSNNGGLEGVLCIDSRLPAAFGPDIEKLLFRSGELIAFILQSIQSGQFLMEEREKVRNLSEASRQLDGTLSLSGIYEVIPELLMRLVNCELAFIVNVDGDGCMRIMNAAGESSHAMTDLEESSTRSLVGWVVKTVNKDIFLSDAQNLLEEMPLFSMREPRLEIHSLGIVPLIVKDEAIGAIVVAGHDVRMLSAVTQDLLIAFGLQVATSLDNAKMYRAMEKSAITDGLTRIYNHRYFRERLESEIARSRRTQEPLALLLMDIDHFKQCNDTYGHPMGDEVLREVADILRREIREIDIVARYGGEEFVVVLVNTKVSGGLIFAERIRKKISKRKFRKEGVSIKVTVSVGVSGIPEYAETGEELIEQADHALYEAKGTGRNRCCTWAHREEPVAV